MPKITIVQAEGANPLYRMWARRYDVEEADLKLEPIKNATTLATAIKIGAPLSWPKALRGLRWSEGEVEQVTEQEIADAKAMIGLDGIGCEPASAVTLAGLRKMVAAGDVNPDEDVVAILTGHVLKDPDYTVNYHAGSLSLSGKGGEKITVESRYANAFTRVPADRDAIMGALGF
jgi:threonine synthase